MIVNVRIIREKPGQVEIKVMSNSEESLKSRMLNRFGNMLISLRLLGALPSQSACTGIAGPEIDIDELSFSV